MATVGISLSVDQTELRELQTSLGKVFTNSEKTQILKRALTKAIAPVLARLKQLTPLGPTGNLQRAATSKIIGYSRSGNAVALVGFRRAAKEKFATLAGGTVGIGPDRAFHQWWLENGTKQRQVSTPADKPYTRKAHQRRMKSGVVAEVQTHEVARQGGYIASSFRRLGNFGKFLPTPRPPRGEKGHRVQTDPAYPNAYFKKSSTPITIPPMPVGGSTGQPPLQTAWDQTSTTAAEILQRELRISLESALNALTRSATGSVDL
jgi:hypothetical protein